MKKQARENVVAFCPTQQQWPQVGRAICDGFGEINWQEESERDHLRPESRRIGVSHGEEIFGGAFAYDFQMSLPGGAIVPVSGLAGVGISPPFQGCGGLHKIMDKHLEQSRTHRDAASVLMASESGIYKRYGYGAATEMAVWQLKTREFGLLDGHLESGRVRLMHDTAKAIAEVSAIYQASVLQGNGALQRSDEWWPMIIGSKTRTWFGGGEQFVVVHYTDKNVADAYALYTLKESPGTEAGHGCISNTCTVNELVALDMSAEISMLSYLQSIAWVRELIWDFGPINPRVRFAMKDPRQLRQRARIDMMWLRPLDLPALLNGRTYFSDGEVLLNYTDPVFSDLSGFWWLKVEGGVGDVTKLTSGDQGLAVDIDCSALGMVLTGGTRVCELASSGIIRGTDDAIHLLDRLLLTDLVPFNLNKF
ncbi:hypothetical protein AB833_18945 [Chromatiales bacterium (ex Bugula neritina AB1)]|nr:hypothetical protein AB833_18945 [Chromatiales bacterium (ex Bugula neritina AB1)]